MAKFKKGDRVRSTAGGYTAKVWGYERVDEVLVQREDGRGWPIRTGDHRRYVGIPPGEGYWWVSEGDLELIVDAAAKEPAEHPALTLVKAEVVRLAAKGFEGRFSYEDTALEKLTQILAAFGLEYREKPPAPQPREFEFAAVGS